MAASAATKGFGTTVEYLVTGPSTYAAIGELVAVTPPNRSRETVDVTHMSSPDGYREFLATLKTGGEATLTFNYTKDGYETLGELFEDDDPTQYRITFPDGSTLVYRAIITETPIDNVEVDGKMGMSANQQLTGKPAFTAGS